MNDIFVQLEVYLSPKVLYYDSYLEKVVKSLILYVWICICVTSAVLRVRMYPHK